MVTRAVNRHTPPRGRHALQAVFEGLSSETASMRTQLEQDRLDLVTLSATVAKLLGDMGRVSVAVTGITQELALLRTEVRRVQEAVPTVPDPLLAMLAEHSADLREQLTGTQQVVAELAGRLTEVLTGLLEAPQERVHVLSVEAPGSPTEAAPEQELAPPEVSETAQTGRGNAHRVVMLAPTVTRLDLVPEAVDDEGDDLAERDLVRVTAARLHAVRRALDG